MDTILQAQERFGELIRSEFERIERMKADSEAKDFGSLDKIVVGILPGDGIGPIIMEQALRVIRALIPSELERGKVELCRIEGMTIENRAAKLQSLPDEVFEKVKQCDVLLKGPMVTPGAGDPWPNLVSANSLLRRGLELFAAVRPIRIPDKGIDWTFFRENIEGEYIWGNKGIQVDEDLAVDFKVQTRQGSERIARAAFEFARKNNKKNVTIVTKANIVKLADGNFIKAVRKVGEEYPEIEIQERLVDAMCAKMLDSEFNKGIEVVVLPNLYGDIVTDVAAEHQGGLRHSFFFQYRESICHVRGDSWHGALPDEPWKRRVCGSQFTDSGSRNAFGPHWICGQKRTAGKGHGYLHRDREKSGPYHLPGGCQRQGVYGLCD